MLFVGAGLFLLIFGLGRFVSAVLLGWETGSPGAESIVGYVDPDVAGLVEIIVLAPILGLAEATYRGSSGARLALTALTVPVLVWEMGRFFGPALHWPVLEVTRAYQQLAASSPAVQPAGPPEWSVTPIVIMTVWAGTAVTLLWLGSANSWYRRQPGKRALSC